MHRSMRSYRASRALAALACLAATLSAGCLASGTKVEQQTLLDLQPGVTTCLAIRERYGPPTSASLTSDGAQQLVYTYTQSQIDPKSYIPLVGPFITRSSSEQTNVVFDCNHAGVLTQYSSTQGQLSVGTGFVTGGRQ